MRKGTQNVYKAWTEFKRLRSQDSVWTDGTTIYSYATPIVWRMGDGSVMMNVARYSVTTSCHQNGLRFLLNCDGVSTTTQDGEWSV